MSTCLITLGFRGQAYYFLLDRIGHQLGLVVYVQLAHQIEFVRLHRFNAAPEPPGDHFHGVPFGN